jgi:hypothetical protein
MHRARCAHGMLRALLDASFTNEPRMGQRTPSLNAARCEAPLQETPAFCRRTLCAPAVVEYLRDNYLVWGGDIRQRDAFQLSGALRAATYPFLAVLANHNSRVTLLTYMEGHVTPDELVACLANVLDQQGAMLVAARAEVEERVRAPAPRRTAAGTRACTRQWLDSRPCMPPNQPARAQPGAAVVVV